MSAIPDVRLFLCIFLVLKIPKIKIQLTDNQFFIKKLASNKTSSFFK